jgi:hypothetical protein
VGAQPAVAADSAGAGFNYNTGNGLLELRAFIAPGSSPVDSIQLDLGSTIVSTSPSGGVCGTLSCPEPGESGSHTTHGGTASFSPAAATDDGTYLYLDMLVNQDPGSVSVQFNYHDGGSSQVTATECGTLSATPNPLPHGTVGQPYSQQLSGQGGASPYTYGLGGVTPGGVMLSGTGLFSGTPVAASDGTYTGSLSIIDANGCSSSQGYQLTIDPSGSGGSDRSVAVSTTLFDLSSIDNSGQSIVVQEGTGVTDHVLVKPTSANASQTVSGTVTLHLYQGTQCGGTALDSVTVDLKAGGLSGQLGAGGAGVVLPGGQAIDPGEYSVQASYSGDANYDAATVCSETFRVGAPCDLKIIPPNVSGGFVGQRFATTFAATGGTPPYTFSATVALPPGLTLSDDGHVSGRLKNRPGLWRLEVKVVDSRPGIPCRADALVDFGILVEVSGVVHVDAHGKGTVGGVRCPPDPNRESCAYDAPVTSPESADSADVAGARSGKKNVTVGNVSGKIAAGQIGSLTLTLNGRGRTLLKRKHELTVTLTGTRRQGKTSVPIGGTLKLRS